MRAQSRLLALGFVTLGLALLLAAPPVAAQTPAGCAGVTYADVVALDQPWLWNRYGALEPAGSVWYRSQVTRDDLNLARTDKFDSTVDSFPRIDYAAVYPNTHRYAGLPVLGMLKGNEIVHSDLTAIIAGPAGSGYLIPNVASTRTYPNRNQPFRELTIIFHDETGAVQAFPQFESDDFNFTLHSVRDSFGVRFDHRQPGPVRREGFNQNNVVPSMEVSLHPQLVFYDVQRSDGSNVGLNPSQFGKQTAAPGEKRTYYWYAGDVQAATVTPVEYGATGLTSADPIKQSNKGLMGSLIIEPATATWALDQDSNLKTTRASATVSSSNSSFKPFHEFAFVIQDDVNLRYSGGKAVPNLTIDDDAENSGQKAVNYRAEPLWYRAGWGPQTPLTGNGPGFRTRQFTQFDQILHNGWVGGDPETPVFQAHAGEDLRFRVVHPSGHTQAHVFEAQGHPWLERPYVLGTNSTQIGTNSISEWFGTRGGVGPTDHFDGLVPDGAGGKFKVTGDYLYRDYPGPRLDAGIWGLLRIIP